jgi:hypothetical protein
MPAGNPNNVLYTGDEEFHTPPESDVALAVLRAMVAAPAPRDRVVNDKIMLFIITNTISQIIKKNKISRAEKAPS